MPSSPLVQLPCPYNLNQKPIKNTTEMTIIEGLMTSSFNVSLPSRISLLEFEGLAKRSDTLLLKDPMTALLSPTIFRMKKQRSLIILLFTPSEKFTDQILVGSNSFLVSYTCTQYESQMDERAAASVADTADCEDNQESPAVELIAADLLSEMFPIQSIPGN